MNDTLIPLRSVWGWTYCKK